MSKILQFDDQAKESLLRGIKVLEKAVSSTLGPMGSNVSIDKKWGSPIIVHDGVSVAKEIELEDPFEDMGARLVKEAASKTNDIAGDGTTTSTIITRAIVEGGFSKIKAGSNPMKIRREILDASKQVIESVISESKPISTAEEVKQIATISSQDSEIGEKVAEAINKVGKDGVVSVEEGSGREITIKFTEGMEFDRGYLSPYFVTNSEKMEVEIKNPYILITDKKITSQQDVISIVDPVLKVTKDIVIIADDIEGEALSMMIVNKLRGTFNVLSIKAPGFGDRRKDILEDIAVLTGGTVISEEKGDSFTNLDVSCLGRAKSIWSDKDRTRIIDGYGEKENVENQIKKIKSIIDKSDSSFDKEKLQERLSKLTNGVALISVGANTEVEMIEKKERIIDAVAATKAALEQGIIPGGSTTLIHASEKLGNSEGEQILKRALKEPFYTLMENSGLMYLEQYPKVAEGKTGMGVDVMDGQFKNMIDAGIVEPTKVVVSAIENAVSVATTIITTKVLITDKKEEKKKEDL